MMRLLPALPLVGMIAACTAPDYSAARDWARSASIATDHPAIAARAATADGAEAMRLALGVTLAALGRMADDGVLPYPEDPFVDLAARATRADARGGAAVASLGRFLRRATRSNWRAPQLRAAIRLVDPDIQVLAVALAGALGDDGAEAALVRRIAADHAALAERASEITSAEMGRRLRDAEDTLRRMTLALPRG